MRSAFISIRHLAAIAIPLDVVSQFLIFHEVRPGAVLMVGPMLVTMPYGVVRALSNQMVHRGSHLTPSTHLG